MKPVRLLSLVVFASLSFAQGWEAKLTPDRKAALDRISANSLKGNLSFLSSDALEGRGSPSRGLDIAAEFIAAQFRKAGLEPAGDDGYFQTSTLKARGTDTEQKVRNVVGVLRGSDPVLKDTFILVSAHYDHLGINTSLTGDQIFNGANDDGSGTVGVIELANALSSLQERPKRSIVFMTFFGEERGLLGSTYYGQHPIFPLAKTVAGINLEQIGRTDDTEGKRENELSMTGYDYSDIGTIFTDAGKPFNIKVTKHPQNSDAFFSRSDNAALARVGIPSHTVCTAFVYPDYHQLADTWDKVDYENLARVLKAAGLGILMIADSASEPHWNPENPRATRYLEAWKKLKGQ